MIAMSRKMMMNAEKFLDRVVGLPAGVRLNIRYEIMN